VAAFLLLAGCTEQTDSLRCVPPLRPAPMVELFLGRGLAGGGEVTEQEWRRFVDDEVTPRFPDGLTVFDARGQWRSDGVIERENSKVLRILAPGGADVDARLDALMDAYIKRFHQRSVLRTDTMGCYRFREGPG
jgi:hypothetical protein